MLDLGLKLVPPPEEPYNDQHHIPGHGTWYKTIGFRHIHGEWGYAYKYHTEPPDLKFIDQRHMGAGEYNLISDYRKTGDKKYIEEWWWKG